MFIANKKYLDFAIPFLTIFIIVLPSLNLPWVTFKYRVQVVKENDFGLIVGARQLIITDINVKLGLSRCLGGICGSEKEKLMFIIATGKLYENERAHCNDVVKKNSTKTIERAIDNSNQRIHAKTTSSSKLFDDLASFLSDFRFCFLKQKEQNISDFEDNMRYDGQINVFFRAAILSMVFLLVAGIFSGLSILTQICQQYLKFMLSFTNHSFSVPNGTNIVEVFGLIKELCNSVISWVVLFTPLLYVAITWKPLVGVNEKGRYEIGFYISLIWGISLLLIDFCFCSEKKRLKYIDTSIPHENSSTLMINEV